MLPAGVTPEEASPRARSAAAAALGVVRLAASAAVFTPARAPDRLLSRSPLVFDSLDARSLASRTERDVAPGCDSIGRQARRAVCCRARAGVDQHCAFRPVRNLGRNTFGAVIASRTDCRFLGPAF